MVDRLPRDTRGLEAKTGHSEEGSLVTCSKRRHHDSRHLEPCPVLHLCDPIDRLPQTPQLDDTNGFVSLRVTATDGTGASVTQSIIRAYGLTS